MFRGFRVTEDKSSAFGRCCGYLFYGWKYLDYGMCRTDTARERTGGSESFDGQHTAEHGACDDPAVEEAHDVSREAGGDERSLAYAFDAARHHEREDDGQRDQRDVEGDFEFAEIHSVASRCVIDEPFGAHHRHAGLDFEYDADSLYETACQDQCDRCDVIVRPKFLRERHVEVNEGSEKE